MFAKRFALLLPLCLLLLRGAAQEAFLNTSTGIYRWSPGCNTAVVTNPCGDESNIVSIAVQHDTIYYSTWAGELKRFKAGHNGSCETILTQDFAFTSMTITSDGIIYSGTEVLVSYNTRTGELKRLGRMPFYSNGDLLVYGDKLLLAGTDPIDWSNGIYEINTHQLSASREFMKAPAFIGLLSLPSGCGTLRYYGLSMQGGSTAVTEIDLANKTLGAGTCNIPLNVMDAAGTSVSKQISISNTIAKHPDNCSGDNGSIRVGAVGIRAPFTYTLLNTGKSNPTGEFGNLREGNYRIRVENASGCSDEVQVSLSGTVGSSGCLDIFMPNAFTPNGDGRNDQLRIEVPAGFKEVSLHIFNRWGTRVYYSKNGLIAWDGSYNSIKQPAGVYVYTLNYLDKSGKQQSKIGSISLLR